MASGAVGNTATTVAVLRWDLLHALPPSAQRLTVRTAIEGKSPDVLIAIDSARRRHVLVLIPAGETFEIAERTSRGIAVQTVDLKTGGDHLNRFVEISCLDAQGHAALDTIALELVDALETGASIGRGQLVLNVLAKWRRFWSGVSQGVLSKEEQLGLFGELWFMSRWLVPAVGAKRAVNMWRGPAGARNDFEHLGFAIEVKTTGRVDGAHVIHGLDQLLEPPSGKLLLFSLLVRDEASGTESLPSLVAQTRGLIGEEHGLHSQFDAMLYAAGYDDRLTAEYAKLALRIRSEGLYHVTEGFPRLLPGSIIGGMPPGIGSVEYELRLDAASEWLLASTPQAAAALLDASAALCSGERGG